MNLLDVGAANGYFVAMAKQAGFAAQGIEISSQAVEWARKLGRLVEKSTLEEYSITANFEYLTALDVLEHIEDPVKFLKSAHEKLTSDGFLLINVPNSGSFFARISGKNWHALVPPEHWFFFNRKSLKILLESEGFKVRKMKSISKSFNISYIFLTIINSPQIPTYLKKILKIFSPVVKGPFGKLKIYLPLFDNLTVIAQVKNLAN
jgi:2-polyprenyl-3-methyl-5-hydroxy-6-metoxy-1,4-benzoquinol methylase